MYYLRHYIDDEIAAKKCVKINLNHNQHLDNFGCQEACCQLSFSTVLPKKNLVQFTAVALLLTLWLRLAGGVRPSSSEDRSRIWVERLRFRVYGVGCMV